MVNYKKDAVILREKGETFDGLRFHFPRCKDTAYPGVPPEYTLIPTPMKFEEYLRGFECVQKNLMRGNTYLANYTVETPLESTVSLSQLYHMSRAKYKVYLPGHCTFFSPETFVQMYDTTICTYPMKGTIDAAVFRAQEALLADRKEQAEHATIVDLLRNDLSRVATNVRVPRFRYVDHISTDRKSLLQVSSHIAGDLSPSWRENLGDIIDTLLPAGSITGAPKAETLRVIEAAETHDRGFYTGVSFLFDGASLDSCVNIRFIEQRGTHVYYKSGGGITAQSDPYREYEEMKDKIYVPLD
ncbi:MAG: aminodeoxychorismate synthase component I [Fibrobacterota bacterium]